MYSGEELAGEPVGAAIHSTMPREEVLRFVYRERAVGVVDGMAEGVIADAGRLGKVGGDFDGVGQVGVVDPLVGVGADAAKSEAASPCIQSAQALDEERVVAVTQPHLLADRTDDGR